MSKLRCVPVVYLAGGTHSGWDDKVKRALPGVLFITPRDNKSKSEDAYTAYDLTGVERCDIIFGFMERDNPGGQGLAVEFGAGAALGKHLIFCEDQDLPSSRYFGMVRSISDSAYTNFEDALSQLAQCCGFTRGRPIDGEFQLLGVAPALKLGD